MKLLLAYPPSECSVTNTHTYSLPLGLGSIATYAKQRMSNLEVKILDGSYVTQEEQKKAVKDFEPDVIGVSPTIGSMHNAYETAELAHEQGAFVVFGGVHSSATWDKGHEGMWKNILLNREFVDAVILYDGEKPMYDHIWRISERVSGNGGITMARDNTTFKFISGSGTRGIAHPSEIFIPTADELPDIDYSLFDLESYFEQTEKRGFGRALTYYAGKGCSKRGRADLKQRYPFLEYQEFVEAMDSCTFCGRNELGLRNFSAEREAKIVRELHDKYGVRGFFNVQDTVNLDYDEPIGLDDSWFRLFIGLEQITQRNIKILKKRYGPNLILQAGIESAVPEMRKSYGKRVIDLHNIHEKTKLLKDEGLQLHASFIFGGRGETKESLAQTRAAIETLSEYDNVTWILVSPQLILPGSRDFRALLQMPDMQRKWGRQDLIDILDISRDFMRFFSPGLTRDYVIEQIKGTFDSIRKTREKDIVLDVKGVVDWEEKAIQPKRPYSE